MVGARSLLFLCTQNVIRSPMAEAIARDLLPQDFVIASLGLEKGDMDAFVSVVLLERGLVTPSSHAHRVDDIAAFDLIITLSAQARDFVTELGVNFEHWDIDDPSLTMGNREQILERYRHVRNDLEARIKARCHLLLTTNM